MSSHLFLKMSVLGFGSEHISIMNITGLVLFCSLLVGLASGYPRAGFCGLFTLQPLYQWSTLQYSGNTDPNYSSNNAFITGIEEFGGRFFISTPRGFASGLTPATLSTIPSNATAAGNSSPVLQPYPDISWHQSANIDCNNVLISVHRTQVDGCNRLWVLDSGSVSEFRSARRICPAKIVVFNLVTDQVVRRIPIPEDMMTPISALTSIALDNVVVSSGSSSSGSSSGSLANCDNGFVYMSDIGSPGVLVYNGRSGNFYRITSPFMYPDPSAPPLQLNGETFTEFYGIDEIAVSGSGSSRALYFQPIASLHIFSIPTSFLQAGPFTGDWSDVPVTNAVNKTSGGIGLDTDPLTGCLLYNPISQNTLNTYSTVFRTNRIVGASPRLRIVFDYTANSANINMKYAVSVDLNQYPKGNNNNNDVLIRLFIMNSVL